MKKILAILALPLMFSISSCTKQPIACIKADKTLVEVGETVSFESCASDANSVEWDFADGATASEANTTHSWTTPGVYVVQLRAVSKGNKKADRYSVAITVKGNSRYLTRLVLKAVPAKKPDNTDWDSGPIGGGPTADVFVKIANGAWSYSTALKSNVAAADLPYTWTVTQENLFMPNADWTIELRDDDSFTTTFVSELMTTWTVNAGTDGANGVISLTKPGYELELHYENRQ